MNYKIIFILFCAVTLPAQAVQKCTDSDGRITYADFCPSSGPAKVENLYIQDTYDAENARMTQDNIRGMEESTRQSEYDRAQRNAKIRRENTLPDTPSSTASNVGGSGSSRPSRTSRSGASFDEQFSDALKSKIDLQKSQAKSGCGTNVDCYGKTKASKSSSQGYWDGYDDAKINQDSGSDNPDYQDGHDAAKQEKEREQEREQEEEQRHKEIQRQMLQ